jgi:hypothetical protein
MKNLTATLCLTLAVLLGDKGEAFSNELIKLLSGGQCTTQSCLNTYNE